MLLRDGRSLKGHENEERHFSREIILQHKFFLKKSEQLIHHHMNRGEEREPSRGKKRGCSKRKEK